MYISIIRVVRGYSGSRTRRICQYESCRLRRTYTVTTKCNYSLQGIWSYIPQYTIKIDYFFNVDKELTEPW